MNKIQSFGVTIIFCILIFGFGIVTLFSPDTEYSETENRTLAQMPSFTLDALLDGSFESDYEEYLTDQFVFRDGWIALKTAAERASGRTQINDIYFAEDDYLIEAHTDTFTTEQAESNLEILAQFVELYAGEFGAEHMTVMLIPNAVDILQEKLPAFASPYDEGEYLASAEEAVREGASGAAADADADGIWFDARSVLQEHSNEEIYYRTDHHWKTLGAFYVWQAWAQSRGYTVPTLDSYEITTVTEEFEGTIQSKLGIHTGTDSIELYLDPDAPSYTVEKDGSGELLDSLYDYSALETKSKYDIFFGGNNALTRITAEADTGRKLLVIKDSYAHCFVPFLLSEFDQIDVLDIRYYNQELSELISGEGYTDLLFLYNASGFAGDTSLTKLLY
ncbi:MAG: hypothetical protein LUG56_08260 [Lachnospiraceae bacterium]|nr:hypothetical protein [Lachnospiraceae bacterium]